MELNWKEDSNLIRKLAKILLGDTLPNGKPVSSIILLDDASRTELQRWANMSDAELAAAQRSGDSIRIDVDDVIRQLEEKYALDPQLLDDLLSVFDADDLELWEEISQWKILTMTNQRNIFSPILIPISSPNRCRLTVLNTIFGLTRTGTFM